jgi:hypothetical protein
LQGDLRLLQLHDDLVLTAADIRPGCSSAARRYNASCGLPYGNTHALPTDLQRDLPRGVQRNMRERGGAATPAASQSRRHRRPLLLLSRPRSGSRASPGPTSSHLGVGGERREFEPTIRHALAYATAHACTHSTSLHTLNVYRIPNVE